MDDNKERDEAILLIRAILAATKGSISEHELQKDFYDQEGIKIPYVKFGFRSLVEFLQSHPDKFRVTKNFANQYDISAVIDGELADLRRLVTGQKSSKKKKKPKSAIYQKSYKPNYFTSPKKTMSFIHRSNTTFSKYAPKSSYSYASKPSYSYESNSKPRVCHNQNNSEKWICDETVKSSYREVSSLGNKLTVTVTEPVSLPINQLVRKNSKIEVAENLWITNAAYHLCEHQVQVTHIADCDKIFLRLNGSGFSEEYEAMSKKLNEFYTLNSENYRLVKFDLNTICVAFEKLGLKFFRVEIKKRRNDEVKCYYLDEGKEGIFSVDSIYYLVDDFLDCKFQAIQVQLGKFENFHKSQYLTSLIEHEFGNKIFLSKRVKTNPLTITLNDKDNGCVSELFVEKHSQFLIDKFEENSTRAAFITYIEEESHLAFIEFDKNSSFEFLMNEINKYYDNHTKMFLSSLNEATRNQIQNPKYCNSNFFCAKYHDARWYRVKFIRTIDSDQVNVFYIDFGNKENVRLDNVMIIPDRYKEFANLPPQAFPVSFMPASFDLELLKDYMYDGERINIKCLRLNSIGIPTVELSEPISKKKLVSLDENVNIKKSNDSMVIHRETDSQVKLLKNKQEEKQIIRSDSFESVITNDKTPLEKEEFETRRERILAESSNSLIQCKLKSDSVDLTINIDRNEHEAKKSHLAEKFYDAPKHVVSIFNKSVTQNLQNVNCNLLKLKPTEALGDSGTKMRFSHMNLSEKAEVVREKLSSLNLNEDQISETPVKLFNEDEEISEIPFDQLECDFSGDTSIFISSVTNPVDFVMSNKSYKTKYQELESKMNQFYANKPKKYKVEKLSVGHIYIYRNPNSTECLRVKYISAFSNAHVIKIYKIDVGYYDAVNSRDLFYATNEFTKLQVFSIKAQLSNLKSDLNDERWSEKASQYFKGLVKSETSKSFKSLLLKRDQIQNEIFHVDLIDENGSIIDQMSKYISQKQ